jgi:hypothetical protein
VAARVAGVYTWGAPRSGDAAFARAFTTAYGDRSYRVRLAGDIVSVPLKTPCVAVSCLSQVVTEGFHRPVMLIVGVSPTVSSVIFISPTQFIHHLFPPTLDLLSDHLSVLTCCICPAPLPLPPLIVC